MSTEHQQYSTANQSLAILQYAQQHGMDVVQTYADHGKSGLDLRKRAGLKQLLLDALSPDVRYRAILVYDVSRWGRFQNPDQGASYEYALTAANVPVHYCAELFENDGSLSSALLKSLKRGMAGEYSRELSVKVWAGQSRLVQLGFRLGGIPGYGLRRSLIDQNGHFKQTLHPGDRKSLQSDRVILVPGPSEEVKVVRKIYRWFVDGLLPERSIAERLNASGIAWIGQRPWTARVVQEILANPKYIGSSVYNRKSFKLHEQKVYNPPDQWICRPHAFEALVTPKQYEDAGRLLASRSRSITTEVLLDRLKRLLKDQGYLSSGLISASSDMPSLTTYRKRFGNMRKAYTLAGFNGVQNTHSSNTDAVIREIREATEQLITKQLLRNGARPTYLRGGASSSFVLDDGCSLRVLPVRSSQSKTSGSRWFIQTKLERTADLTIIVRLNEANTGILDYFIFPRGTIACPYLKLAVHNPLYLQVFRFRNLDFLEELTRRQKIHEVDIWSDNDLARRMKAHSRLAELKYPNENLNALRPPGPLYEPRKVSLCRESFQKQIDLLNRVKSLERKAIALAHSLLTLLADEDFRTALRAEGILNMPQLSEARELLTMAGTRSQRAKASSAQLRAASNEPTLTQLSESLPLDHELLRQKMGKANKLCARARVLLQTYPVSQSAVSLLGMVRPRRQVEIAEQMVLHSNWSPDFVRVLLYATKSKFFIDEIKPRKKRGWSIDETRDFARSSELLLRKLRALGPDLGRSFLLLASCQRYVSFILENVNVQSYIARRHPGAMIALRQSEQNVWKT